MAILHTLPVNAQEGIIASLDDATRARYGIAPGAGSAGWVVRQPAMAGAAAPSAQVFSPRVNGPQTGAPRSASLSRPTPPQAPPVAQLPGSPLDARSATTRQVPPVPGGPTAAPDPQAPDTGEPQPPVHSTAQRRWFRRGDS